MGDSDNEAVPNPPADDGAGNSGASAERVMKAEDAERKLKENALLDAWRDPMAGCKAYSQNMVLCDMDATGEYRFLAACGNRKLKVYSGSQMVSEHFLLEEPTAMCYFYSDGRRPHTPAVAVAGAQNVYIYRNMRPYYKFQLPELPVREEESRVWAAIKSGAMTVQAAIESLTAARDGGMELTTQSNDLLAMDSVEAATDFANQASKLPLKRTTVVTCMAVLNKDSDANEATGCLVIGTEAKEVLILSPAGSAILKRCTMPGIPVRISATGMLDVEYRLIVVGRDSVVYMLRNMDASSSMALEVSKTRMEMESQVVGAVSMAKQVLVACMDRSIHCFHVKGKKLWSLYMPDDILCLEPMEMKSLSASGYIVALKSGEIRLYSDKRLITSCTYAPSDPVTGIVFGKYAREDGCMVIAHASGGLSVRILPRRTNFAVGQRIGPPEEQDIQLKVPKKTRLYVEQTQREREQCVNMHRRFQRDLCKLRLDTARAYVRMITDGNGPTSFWSGANIRITAMVAGLGPVFKLKVELSNSGTREMSDLTIAVMHSHRMYDIEPSILFVPVLLPSVSRSLQLKLTCKDPGGGAEAIKLIMLRPESAYPLLSAVVDMPASMESLENA